MFDLGGRVREARGAAAPVSHRPPSTLLGGRDHELALSNLDDAERRRPSGILSPGFQFGTAAVSVGGSAVGYQT